MLHVRLQKFQIVGIIKVSRHDRTAIAAHETIEEGVQKGTADADEPACAFAAIASISDTTTSVA